MKVDALIMDPKDNVVTCVRDVKAGEVVHYRSKNEDLEILAKEPRHPWREQCCA